MVTLGDSAGTQTQDPQLRRLLLYPAELPNQHLLGQNFDPCRLIIYMFYSHIVFLEDIFMSKIITYSYVLLMVVNRCAYDTIG